MIEQLFKRAKVRCRVAAGRFGIILSRFARELHSRGYTRGSIQSYVRAVEHLGAWLKSRRMRQISEKCTRAFLEGHLPHCRCAKPAPKNLLKSRAAIHHFFEFLRGHKRIEDVRPQTPRQKAVTGLLAAYDRHLDRVCGLSASTRRSRQQYALQFLQWRFGRQWPRLPQLRRNDLVAFVVDRARHLTCSGTRDLACGLRSFCRFLEFSSRIHVQLAGAIPRPVQPPAHQPPKVLERSQWQSFLNGFPRTTPTGRRDYAIALCLSLLALRAGEVAALSLEDLNWREMTLHLSHTKQRRERLLPLPDRLARALVKYLQHGRPPTQCRALFVRHRPPVGQAMELTHVRGAMRRAFIRCGLGPSGTHILRHTWATWAHRRGASLKLVADVLGHKSLNTTTRYAHLNLEELRQAALPWPKSRRR